MVRMYFLVFHVTAEKEIPSELVFPKVIPYPEKSWKMAHTWRSFRNIQIYLTTWLSVDCVVCAALGVVVAQKGVGVASSVSRAARHVPALNIRRTHHTHGQHPARAEDNSKTMPRLHPPSNITKPASKRKTTARSVGRPVTRLKVRRGCTPKLRPCSSAASQLVGARLEHPRLTASLILRYYNSCSLQLFS
jgi:hypothetical protein